MTDDVALESTQEQAEVEAAPKPRVPSQVSEDKPTSQPKAGADDLDKLEAKIESILSRKQQSFKDRRIAKLTEQVEQLAQILESGDEPVSQPDPGRSKAVEPEDGNAFMEAMTAQILDGAGIAHDDPEYEGLVEQYGGRISNPDQWVSVVREFASRKGSKVAKQESSATMASRVTSGGSASPVEGDAEAVAEQLASIQRGEHGSPFSKENKNKIEELTARLNELDPQIDVNNPDLHIDTSALHRVV
jgi:hypothetical protein